MFTLLGLNSERHRLTEAVHAEWKLSLQEKVKTNLKAVHRKLKNLSEKTKKDVEVGTVLL